MKQANGEKGDRGNHEKESQVLGVLASGERVLDRRQSHLHSMDEEFLSLLRQTLSDITSEGRKDIVYTKNFGYEIGFNHCVSTGLDNDEKITYAQRRGRRGYTRFVRERKPEKTSEFSVILAVDPMQDRTYYIRTAFIGPQAAKEPYDPTATEEDKTFWENHALIWDPNMYPFVPKTVYNEVPPNYGAEDLDNMGKDRNEKRS